MCDTQNCYIEINTCLRLEGGIKCSEGDFFGCTIMVSTHDTVVYWIQNAAGEHKHGPVGEKSVRQLLDSFTP